jgi:hypothetical protein
LELHTSDNVEASVLFTSTEQAWSMIESFYTNPDITYLFEKDAAETRGVKILGASLAGEFSSFFKGAPKPVREGSGEELPDMPLFASPSRIIVVGETDFATNLMNTTNANYNLDFLLRTADWLVSDDDIIGIRNREPHIGRFDKILDDDRRAVVILFAQVVNLVLMPLFVIISGFVIAWYRRKRSLQIQRSPQIQIESNKKIINNKMENNNDI